MGAKIYQNKKYIAFFLIPAFVFMLIFLYYPFIQNIINSFQHIKYMGTAADKWNAPFYKNYLEIFKDPKMLIALKNTGIMIIATIVGEVGLAIVLSLLVSNIKKGAGFFRVVYFFPIVISATALGLLFNLVFLYDKGMINQLLQLIGVLDAGNGIVFAEFDGHEHKLTVYGDGWDEFPVKDYVEAKYMPVNAQHELLLQMVFVPLEMICYIAFRKYLLHYDL